jgi:hypothetical protein|tara:strand:- start:273 stop:638 length:366 start_codon:yes stop_codon:yes gene_type:complete
MSLMIFKDQKLVKIFNQVSSDVAQENQNRLAAHGVLFLNGPNICGVCSKGPYFDEDNKIISLLKHHVSYFPQKIAHVHTQCHDKINATDNHFLIQYDKGDSKKFYDNLESLQKNPSRSTHQ